MTPPIIQYKQRIKTRITKANDGARANPTSVGDFFRPYSIATCVEDNSSDATAPKLSTSS